MANELYDTVVIELQKNGKSASSISIKEVDLSFLLNTETNRGDVLDNLVKVMEEGLNENVNNLSK